MRMAHQHLINHRFFMLSSFSYWLTYLIYFNFVSSVVLHFCDLVLLLGSSHCKNINHFRLWPLFLTYILNIRSQFSLSHLLEFELYISTINISFDGLSLGITYCHKPLRVKESRSLLSSMSEQWHFQVSLRTWWGQCDTNLCRIHQWSVNHTFQ